MRFFGPRDIDIQCPRCLKRIRVPSNANNLACKECNFFIPSAYIRDFKQTPPVFVQLFGLTASGKTTFLDMLRLYLYDMDQAWRAFYTQPITELDREHQRVLLNERAQGIMPGATAKRDRDQNEVYIMLLKNMPRWGSRFLVLMDHAGEQFDRLNIDVKEIPFLQHTPVTIMLLSLPDLIRENGRVNDLITSYISSLESYGVNFQKERRQLIIVFSKADLIDNLPLELRDYLSRDALYMTLRNPPPGFGLNEAYMNDYLKWMAYMSCATEEWVKGNVRGGQAMVNMLKDKRIATQYTVMSATGHSLLGGNQLTPLPRRVLDPFFWVLELYKQNGL